METGSKRLNGRDGAPRWVEQDELSRDPVMQDLCSPDRAVRQGVERRRRASSLAPHLFVSRGAHGVFFVNRRPNTVFAFAYAGPDERFAGAAATCSNTQRGENWSPIFSKRSEGQGTCRLAIPQPVRRDAEGAPAGRVLAGGNQDARLRYQIAITKARTMRDREYRAGSDPATDRTVAALVDAWKRARSRLARTSITSEGRIASGSCR